MTGPRVLNQRGFTLLELLISVGLGVALTIGLSSIVYGMVTQGEARNARTIAESNIEAAMRQISSDWQSAQNDSLIAGAEPVAVVTLSWTDPTIGDQHQVVYALVAGNVRRTASINGVVQSQTTVGRQIDGIGFSQPLTSDILHKVSISSSGGSNRVSETKDYYVTLRALD